MKNKYTRFYVIGFVSALLFAACMQDEGEMFAILDTAAWTPAATLFRLDGETDANNVKVRWEPRRQTFEYEIYRDGVLISRTAAVVFEDYGLIPGRTYSYYVKSLIAGKVMAESQTVKVKTAALDPSRVMWTYTNSDGTRANGPAAVTNPSGWKFDDAYYDYRVNKLTTGTKGIQVQERWSSNGLSGWSAWTTLFEKDDSKLEGQAWRRIENRMILSAHHELDAGYTASNFYLAAVIPGKSRSLAGAGGEETYCGHPFEFASRDQSVFVDRDGRAYALLSNNDQIIVRLKEDWSEPEALIKHFQIGAYRETPYIIRTGNMYFHFTSRQSGWYPSQTKYTISTSGLGGDWGQMIDIGDVVTFGSQFNRIEEFGGSYGIWGYRWQANFPYNATGSNIQRLAPLSINGSFCAAEYFPKIERYSDAGLIGVQSGKNLSLGKTALVSGGSGVLALTDGNSMEGAPQFSASTTYRIDLDLGKQSSIKEITLSNRNVGGSETALLFTYYGTNTDEAYGRFTNETGWTSIVNGSSNRIAGFRADAVTVSYRYIRMAVTGMVTVSQNNQNGGFGDIKELTVYGTQ